jgi:PAS domain S-box-containing protein
MKFKKLISIVSICTIFIGIAVILGWVFEIEILKSVIAGYATMKFNTAFCFIITGCILYLLNNENSRVITTLLSFVLILLSTASFFQDIFNFNIGIDQLIFTDHDSIKKGIPNPGRMANITSLCFSLLGLSFLVIRSANKIIGQYILHMVSLFSFISIIGYVLNVPKFYQLSFLSAMAVHTAATLFLISITGSLLNPTIGITRLFTGKTIGSTITRKLFPRMVIALLILSILRIKAHKLGLVDVEFGIALFATSFILVGLFLIWSTASSLDKTDLKRIAAEDSLRRMNEDLEKIVYQRTQEIQAIFDSPLVSILTTDLNGVITNFNKGAERQLGYSAAEVVGKMTPAPFHLESEVLQRAEELSLELGRQINGFDVFLDSAKLVTSETREWTYIKKDGTKYPVQLAVTALRNENNTIYGLLGIAIDISKIKNQSEIIKSQKNDLEILNATKDKFFSIVAHDLKTPLNSLKGFSTLLIDYYDSLSKEEIMEMSQELNHSVDNTIKMADNLIIWAKVQMNEMDYVPKLIQIKKMLSNILEVYEDVGKNKGVHVDCLIDDSLTIVGDQNQIEFIIRNLVNNAIKFTNKGGFVSVTAKSLPYNEVEIAVSDNGLGISDEMIDKLFSIGKKQGRNGTAGEKGTGLGLMLSYEFVKLNGGHIEVESVLGTGTTFKTRFKSSN